jgi:hypothetical protein
MRHLVPAAVSIVHPGAASVAANQSQTSLVDVIQAVKIDTLPADYELVVDTSGSTYSSGPPARVRVASAGGFPALRPTGDLSLLTFDATSSDAHAPARLQ